VPSVRKLSRVPGKLGGLYLQCSMRVPTQVPDRSMEKLLLFYYMTNQAMALHLYTLHDIVGPRFLPSSTAWFGENGCTVSSVSFDTNERRTNT